MQKNVHDKDRSIQRDICELWIQNVTILIIHIIDIFKIETNPGIVYNVAVQFFFSDPYQLTKTSWLVVLVLIVTSHSGKI